MTTFQGAQFTALTFTSLLAATGIWISMDVLGGVLDNLAISWS